MRKSIESHFALQADLVKNYLSDLDKEFNYNACFGSMVEQRDLLLAVKVPAIAEIFTAATEFEQAYLQSLKPEKDYKFRSKKDMASRVEQWAKMHAFKFSAVPTNASNDDLRFATRSAPSPRLPGSMLVSR